MFIKAVALVAIILFAAAPSLAQNSGSVTSLETLNLADIADDSIVVLSKSESGVPGVVHVEVDAEHHLDLVRRLGILRTPTTLVLDAHGREVTRASEITGSDDVCSTSSIDAPWTAKQTAAIQRLSRRSETVPSTSRPMMLAPAVVLSTVLAVVPPNRSLTLLQPNEVARQERRRSFQMMPRWSAAPE